LKQESDAERMANQLRQVKDSNCYEIWSCCARLYSASSFLYNLINTFLRNKDMTKVATLGAYCHLLWFHVLHSAPPKETTFYRGCTLTDDMVEEYKQTIGTTISWPAFTSTSKSRQVADMFCGNTLFIVQLARYCGFRSDISSLSHYPQEEEVIFCAGMDYKIDKVERDSKSGKYLIFLFY
jgi:hypothetical protein